jgi:hypothetical protein
MALVDDDNTEGIFSVMLGEEAGKLRAFFIESER